MPWVDVSDISSQDPPTKRELAEVDLYLSLKKKARFYCDENFPVAAVNALKSIGVDIITAMEVGTTGHPDENHLAEARKRGRILLTCDHDFLDERKFPLIHCPALIVFDFGSGTTDEMISTFQCLELPLTIPQFYDKWVKIHAKQGEWTEYTRFKDGSTGRTRMRLHNGEFQEWRD